MADDTISRVAALTALNGCTEIYLNNLPPTIYKTDAVEAVTALPSAQSEQLSKINDLVEGTIDHFDKDDAMDLLYAIKGVLKNG